MIGVVYHAGGTGKNTANQDLGIKVAHSVGTFFGQLLFGWLADVVGRKRMYGLELIIIIIGTLVSRASKAGVRAGAYCDLYSPRVLPAEFAGSSCRRSRSGRQHLRRTHHVAIHHGSRYRWRLPPICRHHFRVCRKEDSGEDDDGSVRFSRLG
jgi:hypothetical protein